MRTNKGNKRRITTKLAMVGLVATCITGGLVAGTMAKYIDSVAGNSNARVAKFAYAVKSTNAAGAEKAWEATPQDISLFSYINDSGMVGDNGIGTDGKQTVAPGTSGSVKIEITNKSEVAVKPSLKMSVENEGAIPLVYKYKDKYYTDTDTYDDYCAVLGQRKTVKLKLNDGSALVEYQEGNTFNELLKAINSDMKQISYADAASPEVKASDIQLDWYWPYEIYEGNIGNADDDQIVEFADNLGDTRDTVLGTQETLAKITLTAKVIFTQLDQMQP